MTHTDVTFWLPMGFVVAGVLLLLWEMSQPGFFIALPATALIVFGVFGLINDDLLFSFWSFATVIIVMIPTAWATIRIYRRLAPPADMPNTTIGQSLVGRTGRVTTEVVEDVVTGKVRIDGQIWSARTIGPSLAPGTLVQVREARGVHVVVEPAPVADVASEPDEARVDTGSPTDHGDAPPRPSRG